MADVELQAHVFRDKLLVICEGYLLQCVLKVRTVLVLTRFFCQTTGSNLKIQQYWCITRYLTWYLVTVVVVGVDLSYSYTDIVCEQSAGILT